MKVGSTPSTAQGWRPYSATTHPSSAAIHGSGMASTHSRRNQRVSCLRSVHSTKATANRAIMAKPMKAMKRNDQNITGTFGTVFQAATTTWSGVAWRGSAT